MIKLLCFSFLGVVLGAIPLAAQVGELENNVPMENLIHYANDKPVHIPEIKELPPEEDDLYDGGEIRPLRGTLSEAEKEQKGGGFEDDDSSRLPELACSDERLRKQVAKFIYEFNNKKPKKTVPGRREQVLLMKNMRTFEEVEEKDWKSSFEASAALMYLKMNENREIYKLCSSRDNDSKSFRDLNIILYPFSNFYKVVVTNMIASPENMEEATFIYNW